MVLSAKQIFSTEDARRLAQRKLPRLIYDFVEGAAGREIAAARNQSQFDSIMLQPRVMEDAAGRSTSTRLLGAQYGLPVGIAPMGMCNLVCPDADRHIAEVAKAFDIPVCLSSAASSTMENMRGWAGPLAWFQLYFGQSAEASLMMVDRARTAGYETLVLTVDVPQVSRRVRDLRNGFSMPFSMTPRAFWDFATHPGWSLRTLRNGAPSPKNFAGADGSNNFDRGASRAGANWEFLKILRDNWPGRLIVKGVTSGEDARQICRQGVDAVYVSNHGGRQLDSVPPAIDLLPIIREAVGADMPLLFDSGVRNGEDVVKALALGADFVMIGRPALYALGAGGAPGLRQLLTCFGEDISVVLAQLGVGSIADLGPRSLFPVPFADQTKRQAPTPLHIAAQT